MATKDAKDTTNIPAPVKQRGSIRVAKAKCNRAGKVIDVPTLPNYISIPVISSDPTYKIFSPFFLKNANDILVENLWQYGKYWPAHIRDGKLTPEYFEWRARGMAQSTPTRHPMGRGKGKECMGAYQSNSKWKAGDPPSSAMIIGGSLDYIEARKRVYLPEYIAAVKLRQQKELTNLAARLQNGENLLIVDVDGPCKSSLRYYRSNYKVGETFIEDGAIVVTPRNMRIMLNDPKHPFGHGYCFAMLLLQEINELNIAADVAA